MAGTLVVSFALDAADRVLVASAIGGAGEIIHLAECDDAARAAALRKADVLFAANTARELRPGEASLIASARLIQFMPAGIDFIPIGDLPPGVPIATNAGAYAEPMAEHAVSMALAAAKRLLVEHANLARGQFNQQAPNRMLAGGVCGIFGYGAIGRATARLLRAFGMHIHTINRRGTADADVDWMGAPDQLDALLAAADVLVISAPLTRATAGIIGAPELARMKPDAILINLARGEIIDEAALFAHLQAHPHFTACIDAWWIEPVRHGRFAMGHPFMDLPNVIGSPHNSASVASTRPAGLRRAAENCARVLRGEAPLNLIGEGDRYL
ncbi:MAG: 2-hydroxyacid dehydrogenase [Alphaproteobacteria bacterium]|nr:2-hydroxyacid dehydrogenase [Alphaproteobacteria bacterium]